MKGKIIFWPALICALLLYFVIILPIREEGKRKRRVELHLLNMIQAQMSSCMDSGFQLPTNWIAISNCITVSNAYPETWERLTNYCESEHFPPLTEFYTVLPHPVDVDYGYIRRSVFLVRSSSCKWSGLKRGRWVCFLSSLKEAGILGVRRTWISDEDLSAQIAAQLPANLKNKESLPIF